MGKIKVGIIGTGNIGADLLMKVARSSRLECVMFAGRRADSPGLELARARGFAVSDQGVAALAALADELDVVFDATNAEDHRLHVAAMPAPRFTWIDLTPSRIGTPYVPALGVLGNSPSGNNYSLITCGAQASTPIIDAVARVVPKLDYVEVVSAIAGKSAGPGTRANLDEYIYATEEAVRRASGAPDVKAVLIVNPVEPEMDMVTSISFIAADFPVAAVRAAVAERVEAVRRYAPGYAVATTPTVDGDRLVVRIKVQGCGDYLPAYAGNLDIITCAAVELAETGPAARADD